MTSIALPSDNPAPTITSTIAELKPQLQRALPRGMDADRIARLALTAVRKDKALAKCDPMSFAGALLTASALGLEPGVNGEAWLVAYGRECTFIPGYQGLAKLFYQHPLARHLECEVVYERDDFDYAKGTDPYLRHKPALGDRGQVVAYYAAASLSTGAKAFVVLTPDEVKALRGGKVGPSGKIADPMRWMERKTVLRQLFKLLPKSTTLQTALADRHRPVNDITDYTAMDPATLGRHLRGHGRAGVATYVDPHHGGTLEPGLQLNLPGVGYATTAGPRPRHADTCPHNCPCEQQVIRDAG
jgi:recombination protein RecT